jgi:hypothetical protein
VKKLLLLLVVLTTTGCATAHDYCVSNADHYASYDECYSERVSRKQAMANAFRTMGDSMRGGSSQVNCTSYGLGNTVQTSCR